MDWEREGRFGVGAGLSGCCGEWIGRGKEGLALVLAYLGVAVNGLGEGRKVWRWCWVIWVLR